MRYERKYLVEKNNSLVFKQFLIRNNFKSVYEKRKVNSIYFDTNDFKFYEENINGISRRKKVILRWYNNQFKKPTVEIKIKKGFLGWKENHKFLYNNNIFNIHELLKRKKFFKDINIFNKYNLYPVINISYIREYFQSFCGNFRATVDTDIKISNDFSDICNKFILQKDIMEFKYDSTKDESFRIFLKSTNFKFRFQKYSKYVSGILFLKKNLLV